MTKKILAIIFICLLGNSSLKAGHEVYNGELRSKETGAAALAPNKNIVVKDAQYAAFIAQGAPSGTWASGFVDKTIKNRITFSVDHADSRYPTTVATTYSVNLSYTYKTFSGGVFVNHTGTKTLSVVVDIDPSNVNKDKVVFEFEGGNYLNVKVNNIKVNGTDQTSNFNEDRLLLMAEVDVERYYNFNPNTAYSGNLTHCSNLLSTSGELEITWEPMAGAEEYDLEWTFVNNYDMDSYGNYVAKAAAGINLDEFTFEHNSTRITTTNSFYKIPYLYEKGYILYRLRALGRTSLDNYTTNYAGKWSYEFSGSTHTVADFPTKFPNTSLSGGCNTAEGFIAHETILNWQASMVYAEEGKSKAVVSYFDGSLHNRQSVTKSKTSNEVIVGETIYDYEGRPAISVLPVPANSNKIEYKKSFNLKDGTIIPYNKSHFDQDASGGTCTVTTPGMDPAAGASNYYSPSNPNQNNENINIPDANKKPFTQVEYMPDNTGRVRAQSGVGPDHQLGTDHETKYFYGSPFQKDIDRLFGTEVGNAERYKKNMVVDANGQTSISYIDPAGKTIATSLAGGSPNNLVQLNSIRVDPVNDRDTIDILNKVLIDDKTGKNNLLDWTAGTLIAKDNFMVPAKGAYDFNYEIRPEKFDTSCTVSHFGITANTDGTYSVASSTANDHICYSCVYDVSISLKNECGVELFTNVYPAGTTMINGSAKIGSLDSTCSANAPAPFITNWTPNNNGTDSLTPGTYSLVKTLKLNQEALDEYTRNYLDSNYNDCLIKMSDFVNQSLSKADFTGCNITCEQCLVQLGTYDKYSGADCEICLTEEEYQNLQDECNQLCNNKSAKCEAAYEALKADMSPGGQYAQYAPGGGIANGVIQNPQPQTFTPYQFPVSVLNESNSLPAKFSYVADFDDNAFSYGTIGEGKWRPTWRNPYNPTQTGDKRFAYLDENGNIAYVALTKKDGVYTPSVFSTYESKAFKDAKGNWFIEPRYLNSAEDFKGLWEESWAQSLVPYHPEYALYQRCIEDNPSNDFDAIMAENDKLEDARLEMNSTYGITNANPMYPLGGAPGGSPVLDPYFKEGGNGFSKFAAMQDAMLNYKKLADNTYLSIWQFAYIMKKCPNADPNSACSVCAHTQSEIDNLLNASCNPSCSLKNEYWELFGSLYYSLKQGFQEDINVKYSIQSNSYNGCIGTANFNPIENGFAFQIAPSNLNSIWSTWGWNSNWPATGNPSQYYNFEQTCNNTNYVLYSDKQPRFPTAKQLLAMGGTVSNTDCYDLEGNKIPCPLSTAEELQQQENIADLNSYLNCGQCPQSLNLQTLLAGLAATKSTGTQQDLTSTAAVQLSCKTEHNEFTSELREDLGFAETDIVSWTYDNTATTPIAGRNYLKAYLKNGNNSTTRTLQLLFPANIYDQSGSSTFANIYNFADVTEVCCLKSDPSSSVFTTNINGSFTCSVTVTIKSGDPAYNATVDSYRKIDIVGNIDRDLKTCTFEPVCKPSANATNLQNLMNALLYKPSTQTAPSAFFNSIADQVNLINQPYAAFLTGDLATELNKAAPNGYSTQWYWSSSVTSNVLTAYIRPTTSATNGQSCGITITTPSATYNPANIIKITGIQPDPSVSNGFKAYALIGHWVSDVYVKEWVSISGTCDWFNLGTCTQQNATSGIAVGSSNRLNTTLGSRPCNYSNTIIKDHLSAHIPESSEGIYGDSQYTINFPFGSPYTYSDIASIYEVYPNPTYANIQGDNPNFIATVILNNGQKLNLYGNWPFGANSGLIAPSGTTVNCVDQLTDNTNTDCSGGTPVFTEDFEESSTAVQKTWNHTCAASVNQCTGKVFEANNYTTSNTDVWSKDNVVINPNTSYNLSFYSHYSCSPDNSQFDVYITLGAGTPQKINTTPLSPIITSGQEWKKFNLNNWNSANLVSSNQAVTLSIRLITGLPLCDYPLALDDISFKACGEVTPPCAETELLTDGGFTASSSAHHLGTNSTITESAYNHTCTGGNYCQGKDLMIGWPGSSNNPEEDIWYQNITIKPNTNYNLNFYADVFDDGDLGPSQFDVYITKGSTSTRILTSTLPGDYVDGDWTKFSLNNWNSGNIVSSEEEEVKLSIRFISSPIASTLSIDDISFKSSCSTPSFNSLVCNTPAPSPDLEVPDGCVTWLVSTAYENAKNEYNDYIAEQRKQFEMAYKRHCLDVYENFEMRTPSSEHHYTLYYYDQAGNLVRTVPPQGVNKIMSKYTLQQVRVDRRDDKRTVFTKHTYPTTYKYNSLNQLVAQSTPDNEDLNIWSGTALSGISSQQNVQGMAFNGVHGLAVTANGTNGAIYTYNAGTQTWTLLPSLTIKDLNDVFYLSSTNAIALGKAGTVVYTTDNGSTWYLLPFPNTNIDLLAISQASTTSSITVYDIYGQAWTSTDIGQNWTHTTAITLASGETLIDMSISGSNGVAISNQNNIYKYNGSSWSSSNNITSVGINHLSSPSATLTTAVGLDGTLLSSANGGTTWTEIANNLSADIKEVTFATNTIGFALDANNNIYSTNNGGTSFTQLSSVPTGTISSLQTLSSASQLYCIINNQVQVYTYSGTPAWSGITNPTGITPARITVSTSGMVLMGSTNGNLYNLSSGAWSAISISSNPMAGTAVKALSFTSLSDGYVLDANGNVYYLDSGTLTQVGTGTFNAIKTTATGQAWAVGNSGAAVSISGSTATATNTSSSANLNNISVDAAGNTIATTTTGEIWTYASSVWTDNSNTITPPTLKAVKAMSNGDAYAAGTDGTILKYNGTKWNTLKTASNTNINDIDANASDVMAVANSGSDILHSSDAGLSFTPVSNNLAKNLYKVQLTANYAFVSGADNTVASAPLLSNISFSNITCSNCPGGSDKILGLYTNGTNLTAVGENGKIYSGTTGSINYANSFEPNELNDVAWIDADHAIAVGQGGSMLSTSNAGGAWKTEISGTSQNLKAIVKASSTVMYAVGDAGTLCTITYNGTNFASSAQSLSSQNFNDIAIVNNNAIVVGNNGTAFISVNAGVNWTAVTNTNTTNNLNAVQILSANFASAVGDNGTVVLIKNLDNGATSTWTKSEHTTPSPAQTWPKFLTTTNSSAGTNLNLNDVYFKDYTTAYAAGQNGFIMKTTNGGTTWFTDALPGGNPSGNINVIAATGPNNLVVAGAAGASLNVTDMRNEYSSLFYYDALGRLVASQNSKQYAQNPLTYSYTIYDALGRIKEVGEMIATTPISTIVVNGQVNIANFGNWIIASGTVKSQVTTTHYDDAADAAGISIPGFTQHNLRKRVSYTTFDEDPSSTGIDHATYYDYDVHGNVKSLVQHNPALSPFGGVGGGQQQYKRMDYEYDLISGKVNKVSYQAGEIDQFYHKYQYDADNRITNVLTSSDGVIWDQDAKYLYYRHGPLARTEIGDLKVQGIDYAYTIQGWIKAVNSNNLQSETDMGHDGKQITTAGSTLPLSGGLAGGLNCYTAQDEFGYSLGYFKNDYLSIGSTTFMADQSATALETGTKDLYNGNISQMITGIKKLVNNPGGMVQARTYQYDQLNRIKKALTYNGMNVSSNSWTGVTATQAFYEDFSYDANGNILTLNRKNENAAQMDALDYKYQTADNGFAKNTNKLRGVNDDPDLAAISSVDIDNQTIDNTNHANDNYQYDNIGNLIKDKAEGIDNIAWTVYGKIKNITRDAKFNVVSHDADGNTVYNFRPDLEFAYDASGNRIMKVVKPRIQDPNYNGAGIRSTLSPQNQWKYTYYLRDASGNQMAVYKKEPASNSGDLYLAEQDIYGSSRLGIKTCNLNVENPASMPAEKERILGIKNYELSNHLGNVLAVITDNKLPMGHYNETVGTGGYNFNGTFVDVGTGNGNYNVTTPGHYTYVGNNQGNYVPFGSFEPVAGNTGNYTLIQGGDISYYTAQTISATDYYCFGAPMPGRQFNSNKYRYGFNGKENDPEDGCQDYGFRIYNPSLGKFLSVDPLTAKYPMLTPYQFASNRPIDGVDLDGLEYATFTIYVQKTTGKVLDISVTKDYELTNKGTKGAGIQYNYVFVDQNGIVETKTKFVKNNVYGIYNGSKNPQLPEEGGDYKDVHDDYSLAPIDGVDKLGYEHDKKYDKAKITGLKGVVLSEKSTPANEDYIKGVEDINKKAAAGECDPVSNKDYSKEELKAGNWASKMFKKAERVKEILHIKEKQDTKTKAPAAKN